MIKKYNINIFRYIFFILVSITFSQPANSDLSTEELIKGRKAIFSKNYSTAKKVQTFASKGDFERAKSLMLEMSENYKNLLEYFPDNSMKGFKTEALPAIWENKDEFYNLMTKLSGEKDELKLKNEKDIEKVKKQVLDLEEKNIKLKQTVDKMLSKYQKKISKLEEENKKLNENFNLVFNAHSKTKQKKLEKELK